MNDLHVGLVAACVADDDAFPAALDRCMSAVQFDGVDPVSAELLPLLYRRVEDLDLEHPSRRRLRYFYLQTWRRNQMLLHRARSVLEHLDDAGTPAVVLKGGAIASSRYRDDLGVRPMGDLDVLISPGSAPALLRWMLDHGWHVDDTLGWTHSQYVAAHHAVSMHHGTDGAVDVHVGLLSTDHSPDLDADLIRTAEPASLGGLSVRVLDTTSQIMHTLSHSNPNGLRHIVDALYLIADRTSEIDWDVVCDQVIARRSIARTMETIERLSAFAPSAVPATVVDRLEHAPRHWSDWSYQSRPMASLQGVRIFASRWAQRSRGQSPWVRLQIAGLLTRHYLHAAAGRRTRP